MFPLPSVKSQPLLDATQTGRDAKGEGTGGENKCLEILLWLATPVEDRGVSHGTFFVARVLETAFLGLPRIGESSPRRIHSLRGSGSTNIREVSGPQDLKLARARRSRVACSWRA